MYRTAITVFVRICVRLVTRTTVVGAEHVPASGPILVVANHLSWADPPIFVGTFPRAIRFMAKEELWAHPILNWLGRNHGEVRVRRGEADRGAIREAQTVLDEGDALAILPEGTRSKVGGLLPGQGGAAFVALRAGVPILPAAIWGSERIQRPKDLLRRPKVTIRFGPSLRLDPAMRRDLPGATDQIMLAIGRLLPPAYHGAYADRLTGDHPV